jgi:hypothetical protein
MLVTMSAKAAGAGAEAMRLFRASHAAEAEKTFVSGSIPAESIGFPSGLTRRAPATDPSALRELVDLLVAHGLRHRALDRLPRPNSLALLAPMQLAAFERRQTLSFFDRHQPGFRMHLPIFAHRHSPHVSAQVRVSRSVSVSQQNLKSGER